MGKKAVAIKYTEKELAPRIIAKGKEKIAEQLLAIARENNIPIEINGALIDVLMNYEVGDYIPEELYSIIAEILAFVYRLELD